MKIKILILQCLVFLICSELSANESIVNLNQIQEKPIHLAKYMYVLEDTNHQIEFQDLRLNDSKLPFHQNPNAKEAFNYSYSKSTYWLKVKIVNPYEYEFVSSLVVSYPRLKTLDLYFETNEGVKFIPSGYAVAAMHRPYPSRNFVFPIVFPKNATSILYLKVQSPNAINLPIQLWKQKSYDRHEIDDHVLQAIYFGMTLAMIVFNLFVFLILRDISYLLYVLVVLSSAIAIATHNGIASEYLWDNSPWLDQYAINLLISVVLILFLIFMRTLLQTKKVLPRLDRINWILTLIQLILPILYIVNFDMFIKWLVLSHTITSLWILIIGVICSFKRQRIAYFFLLAFAFLFLALIISTLRALGYIPTNVFTMEGPQYGSAAEMMLLAFALADRYNFIIKEKEIAENKVKINLERSNLELEEKVKERTFKLNQTLNVLRKDLFVAKKIQENSISVDVKLLEQLNFVFKYLPVSEVGGDFFDITHLKDSRFRILVADATGHGVHAAMITMAIKGLYDPIKEFELTPSKVMEIFNEEFMDNFVSLNSLLTAIIIDIHFEEQTIQFASAGHPSAVLIQNGKLNLLAKTGRMIGLKKQTQYENVELKFESGNRLFIFTDGVYEAFNQNDEEFGEEKLHELFLNTTHLSLSEVEEELLKSLQNFQNGQERQDDLTILGFDL
ncbi:7TM diverse intracellular signaling domain-containing protein [Leptospira levettii]|uniref:7TM diverse intracellular signaling domain-containing protein n=1 Tax=Leptospira levettii TaxID=2023178 RepID=UPI00223E4F9E|nr:7TM diverse intracellular signaling domain-containing protein [Leptospira levettii]MCW7474395.1 SpoIIE family protein phosphatase [Leptospira levettii]